MNYFGLNLSIMKSSPVLQQMLLKCLIWGGNCYVYYLLSGEGKQSKSGEVTMVLEEAWDIPGGSKPAQRGRYTGVSRYSNIDKQLSCVY